MLAKGILSFKRNQIMISNYSRYRPRLWNIDNLIEILELLSLIKQHRILGPKIHWMSKVWRGQSWNT